MNGNITSSGELPQTLQVISARGIETTAEISLCQQQTLQFICSVIVSSLHMCLMHYCSSPFRYVLNNLQPGEAVVIVDYKMKLKLGMRSREIQRDWYGKRGISLHGFYVVAQVGVDERRTEVLDLWSEDTKQDAWFTQSALDVGFSWMEKVFPNFQVYLFSGRLMYIIVYVLV